MSSSLLGVSDPGLRLLSVSEERRDERGVRVGVGRVGARLARGG